MQNNPEIPNPLTHIPAKLPRVRVTYEPKDQADIEATKALLQLYTDKDGFKCPRCNKIITDPTEAVEHLAEEINNALTWLERKAKS